MPRSKYVYVVTDEYGPIVAFTVKAELNNWWKRERPIGLPYHKVYRMRDNPSDDEFPKEVKMQ